MRELTKSIIRRRLDSRFALNYFVGNGIDIGGKPDPLSLYREFFPLITNLQVFDLEDGDATYMTGVDSGSFDFVHSSHCLEHLTDPFLGLFNWFRILRPGGHLVITIPDEDLYEQGLWPSKFNDDHKWTFTINTKESWSPKSVNLFQLIESLGNEAQVRSIQLQDLGYRYTLPRMDQTLTPISESAIEVIIKKSNLTQSSSDLATGAKAQPPADIRIHLNQYLDDHKRLRQSNQSHPPFLNSDEI